MFVRSKQTAASFVADVQSGGVKAERAIAQLFQQQGGSIIRFIENRNGNIADAEDVLQEAMTALVLNIRKGSFKGDSAVHTYLFAIAKGIWYKRFNKTVRGREIVDSLEPQEEADYQNAEYDLLESEQTQLLSDLFSILKNKCKETLILWSRSFSMTEIAEQLGFSSSQVAMNKKNKCLKELHTKMHNDPKAIQLIQALS